MTNTQRMRQGHLHDGRTLAVAVVVDDGFVVATKEALEAAHFRGGGPSPSRIASSDRFLGAETVLRNHLPALDGLASP